MRVPIFSLYLLLFVTFGFLVNARHSSSESLEGLKAEIDVFLEDKKSFAEIERYSLEGVRNRISKLNSTNTNDSEINNLIYLSNLAMVGYVDQRLDSKFVEFADTSGELDYCSELRSLVEWSKVKLRDAKKPWERYLNALFLIKSAPFFSEDLMSYALAHKEIRTNKNPSIGSRGLSKEFLQEYSKMHGIHTVDEDKDLDKILVNILQVHIVEEVENNSFIDQLFGLVFELTLQKTLRIRNSDELRLMEQGLVNLLSTISVSEDPGSVLSTYSITTALLSRDTYGAGERSNFLKAISADGSKIAYKPYSHSWETLRGGAARAIPLDLYQALTANEAERINQDLDKKLLRAIEYFVSPEVLPWLLLHSFGRGAFDFHNGSDGLGSHFLLPVLPYVSASIKYLETKGIKKERLDTIKGRLDVLFRNLFDLKNHYVPLSPARYPTETTPTRVSMNARYPYFLDPQSPLLGFALLPLMGNGCDIDTKKVDSTGILADFTPKTLIQDDSKTTASFKRMDYSFINSENNKVLFGLFDMYIDKIIDEIMKLGKQHQETPPGWKMDEDEDNY